jgi:hypothetical protein
VASAAGATDLDLLLQALESADWDVTFERAACGSFALAVKDDGGSSLRITAFAKTRDAAALLVFEQVWARLDAGRVRAG